MVRRNGVQATEIVADLADEEQLSHLINQVRGANIDILVNNAGTVVPVGSTVDCNFDDWIGNSTLNLISAARLTKE
jgi:short-subunit dehydrogenase